jgi:NAD(P)-dependent dehydrogenase (short-subunit alcohol dehydrogenase family)
MSDQIAIVTGGNRGIGREIARQLMRHGIFVVIGARNAAKCEHAVAELSNEGSSIAAFPLDVDSGDSVRGFVEYVQEHHGTPGILVNNAGIHPEVATGRVLETPMSVWRATFETNLLGVVRLCREVVPRMQKSGYGRVVNIASGLGQLDHMTDGRPAYRASKAALNALTRTLAAEVAGTGVLVNSMTPGWVRSNIGGPDAPRSVEEGADTAVWLSLLPPDGPTGHFFRDRKPIPW